MICKNCGTTIQQGLSCTNCGASLITLDNSMRHSSSNSFSHAAIALGVIGLFIVPILFGGIGIALAAIAKSKGEKKAVPALIFTIVATVLGLIIGAIIGAAAYS